MIRIGNRPKTLHEVSRRALSGVQAFDTAILEFLDFFYSNPAMRPASLAGRPEKLDAVRDAYVSAVAEHLAHRYGLPVPAWADRHGFDLTRPYFAGGLESLKATLLVESPTAFRRRMLFVSKDALDRPRAAHEVDGGLESDMRLHEQA
jgi:hypothetical protein